MYVYTHICTHVHTLHYDCFDRKWHPDKNQESEESIKKADQMFAAVAEAYKVLGDEKRRRFYDQVSSSCGPISRPLHISVSTWLYRCVSVLLILIADEERANTHCRLCTARFRL